MSSGPKRTAATPANKPNGVARPVIRNRYLATDDTMRPPSAVAVPAKRAPGDLVPTPGEVPGVRWDRHQTDRHQTRGRMGVPLRVGMDDFYAALAVGEVTPTGIMNYLQRLLIAERCRPGGRVLDVCCGRGLQLPGPPAVLDGFLESGIRWRRQHQTPVAG